MATCKVYEMCYDQAGSPLASVQSYAAIVNKPYDDGTAKYDHRKVAGTYVSGTGELYWNIVQGARVAIEIEDVSSLGIYTVPAETTARLGDLTAE